LELGEVILNFPKTFNWALRGILDLGKDFRTQGIGYSQRGIALGGKERGKFGPELFNFSSPFLSKGFHFPIGRKAFGKTREFPLARELGWGGGLNRVHF